MASLRVTTNLVTFAERRLIIIFKTYTKYFAWMLEPKHGTCSIITNLVVLWKGCYYLSAHRLHGHVLLTRPNSTFLIFAVLIAWCSHSRPYRNGLSCFSAAFSVVFVYISSRNVYEELFASRSDFFRFRSFLLSFGTVCRTVWSVAGPILRNFSGCTISKVHVWCNALTLSKVTTS